MPPNDPLPLVGRDDELALLLRALGAAADGQGSAWLVTREAGIAKTRLRAAYRTAAEQRGALVL